MTTTTEFKIEGRYNWIGQPERLIFLGRCLYPDGFWYQFAKVDDPNGVWCEVRKGDLVRFERTKDATP